MKNTKRKIGFTLAELLVVVVVLAVLAGVAVPKFTRVLETRKTSEAEQMLSAVRMEQEKRCTLGKSYTKNNTKVSALASLNNMKSANYEYQLGGQGAQAQSRDTSHANYQLKMLSYRDGRICCDDANGGNGDCKKLNKDYEPCGTLLTKLSSAADECALPEDDNTDRGDDCATNPAACGCTSDQVWDGSACVARCGASKRWDGNSCVDRCSESEVWTGGFCMDRCISSQMWNGTDCVDRCSAGQTWNGTSCEDTCTENAELLGAFNGTPTASDDTCDGDITGQFTCGFFSNGTCTDVYGFTYGLTSVFTEDPFSSLVNNDTLLAIGTGTGTHVHGNCGSKYQCGRSGLPGNYNYYCCNSDCKTSCNWTIAKAQHIDDPGGVGFIEPKLCIDDKVWNAELQRCECPPAISICGPNKIMDATTCECSDISIAEPGHDNEMQYYRREVTCCGAKKYDGGGFELGDAIVLPGDDGDEYYACPAVMCQNVNQVRNAQCQCECPHRLSCKNGYWDEESCSCKFELGDRCVCEKNKPCLCFAEDKLDSDEVFLH